MCVILVLLNRCVAPKMKDYVLFIVYNQLKLTTLVSKYSLNFALLLHLFS
jgi:hypothetical protein